MTPLTSSTLGTYKSLTVSNKLPLTVFIINSEAEREPARTDTPERNWSRREPQRLLKLGSLREASKGYRNQQ